MFVIVNWADFMWYRVGQAHPDVLHSYGMIGIEWVRNPTLAERFDCKEDANIVIKHLQGLFDMQDYAHALRCVQVEESGEISDKMALMMAAAILRSVSEDYLANKVSNYNHKTSSHPGK